MADYPGVIIDPDLQATPADRISTLGNNIFASGDFLLSLTDDAESGSTAGTVAGSAVHTSIAGILQKMFGFNLFERIIVIPRNKGVGFILSSTQFPVEVWNTFHDASEDLTAITITGSGGIVVTNPFTLPKTIGPQGSIIFQAVLPGSGDVNIDLDVVFAFAGISGTDMLVVGSRILVFSVAPDWEEGITETISFLTNVLIAYDDSEQRRSLRRLPRRGVKFRAKTLNARDAAGMESLIWGWQHQPFGVPFWADQQPLLEDLAAGSFVIAVNTVDRLFAAGGVAMIWTDEFTFEALTISAMDDGSITVSAPTQFDWKANPATLVVPIFLGRLANALEVIRNWSQSDEFDAEFQGEALQIAPQPAASLTQFKGIDVLEIAPNWRDGLQRVYNRSTVTMDPGPGPITVADKGGTPVVQHDFPWWIDSHQKVTAFRAFLLARLGQFNNFWTPTWDADLVLAADATAGTAVLLIKAVDYTRFFFPDSARQYLALISRSRSPSQYVQVSGSVDNGDGTETLTLSAPLAADVSSADVMVSFLTLCRQGSDDSSIDWFSTEYAEAAIPVQEVPRELPA
jgi:hypothetical protein